MSLGQEEEFATLFGTEVVVVGISEHVSTKSVATAHEE